MMSFVLWGSSPRRDALMLGKLEQAAKAVDAEVEIRYVDLLADVDRAVLAGVVEVPVVQLEGDPTTFVSMQTPSFEKKFSELLSRLSA